MNKKQMICLWVIVALIAIMCLFPPWKIVVKGGGSYLEIPQSYRSIFLSPFPIGSGGVSANALIIIDFDRLGLQVFVVALIGGLLIYSFRR
jgi:hypothetical protein